MLDQTHTPAPVFDRARLPHAMRTVAFWGVQASAFLVFVVPFAWGYVALWALSHYVRMLGLGLAFHRYYAHRAFKMSRGARFVWTAIATAAMQKGPLWWAGNHIDHHKYADREGDPHSPKLSGFYHAHLGWFLDDARYETLPATNPVVRDFSQAPEIAWLDKYHVIPPVVLAVALYLIGGLPWLVWGFCLPTVTLAHATFCVNTVNHLWGSRRFDTHDDSRNNAAMALVTAGEAWHNNHHRYQRAARNGFYWWEFDPAWYIITLMAWAGLAWDVQAVPARVYQEADDTARRRALAEVVPPIPAVNED
jgi:stearoyl-CoA desaturase (Delta-9 desaturase)